MSIHETIEGSPLEGEVSPSGCVEVDRFTDPSRIYLEAFDYGGKGGQDDPLSACLVLSPAQALALADVLRVAAS